MNELDVALEAARAAVRIIREHAGRRNLEVASKSSGRDLVTEVDRACENAIRAIVDRHMPGVPVLGEEGGGGLGAGPRWIVDPLDGTTNFIHGFPYYCTSVALHVDGRSEVGVVIDAVRGCEYTARRGKGAFVDGHRMAVSGCTALSEALLATGFPYDVARSKACIRYFEAMITRSRAIRRGGAAALDLALVAYGAVDGFWEFDLAAWDVAAGMLLIEEAGGRVTAVDGGEVDLASPNLIASNGRLHEAIAKILAEA